MKKYIVFTLQYEAKNEELIESLVKDLERSIDPNHGKVRRVYHGSDDRIVSAVEKIMKLTQ